MLKQRLKNNKGSVERRFFYCPFHHKPLIQSGILTRDNAYRRTMAKIKKSEKSIDHINSTNVRWIDMDKLNELNGLALVLGVSRQTASKW